MNNNKSKYSDSDLTIKLKDKLEKFITDDEEKRKELYKKCLYIVKQLRENLNTKINSFHVVEVTKNRVIIEVWNEESETVKKIGFDTKKLFIVGGN